MADLKQHRGGPRKAGPGKRMGQPLKVAGDICITRSVSMPSKAWAKLDAKCKGRPRGDVIMEGMKL